jgi:hypothetical protein
MIATDKNNSHLIKLMKRKAKTKVNPKQTQKVKKKSSNK